jgi:hypothetical protein
MGDKLKINPWVKIWVQPRETIRALIQYSSTYLFPLLCMIYGFPVLLQMALNFSLGDRFSLSGIVVGALILAVVPGFLIFNISAGLFYWVGKWIGGTGTFQEIRAAVAWSNVPSLVNGLIWILNMMVFGKRIFSLSFGMAPLTQGEMVMLAVTSLIQLILAVWAFIILVKVLGEVQGFSAWKGLLNVCIAFFIIVIGFSLLFWVMGLFTGGAPTNLQMK